MAVMIDDPGKEGSTGNERKLVVCMSVSGGGWVMYEKCKSMASSDPFFCTGRRTRQGKNLAPITLHPFLLPSSDLYPCRRPCHPRDHVPRPRIHRLHTGGKRTVAHNKLCGSAPRLFMNPRVRLVVHSIGTLPSSISPTVGFASHTPLCCSLPLKAEARVNGRAHVHCLVDFYNSAAHRPRPAMLLDRHLFPQGYKRHVVSLTPLSPLVFPSKWWCVDRAGSNALLRSPTHSLSSPGQRYMFLPLPGASATARHRVSSTRQGLVKDCRTLARVVGAAARCGTCATLDKATLVCFRTLIPLKPYPTVIGAARNKKCRGTGQKSKDARRSWC